jgi:hypothetical protein
MYPLPSTYTLLTVEMDAQCTYSNAGGERDKTSMSILLVVDRDTPYTSTLQALEKDTPYTSTLLVAERNTSCIRVPGKQ